MNFDLSYDYAQHPVSSLSRGAFDPFSIPPQLPAAAASDYTAGTDSEALGRLPHGGEHALLCHLVFLVEITDWYCPGCAAQETVRSQTFAT